MKKLTILLLAIFAVSITTGAFAQITPNFDNDGSRATDTVGLSLTFTGGNTWNIAIKDADCDGNGSDITSLDTSGVTLNAAGTNKVVVAKCYLDIDVSGTWEVVTYTDNIGGLDGLPADWGTMTAQQRTAWVEARSGLQHDTLDLVMPVKIRTEAIEGDDYAVAKGGTIPDADYTGDAAVFGYIPELVNEIAPELNNAPKIVAQIGLTPGSILAEWPEMSFGIDEATAGSGTYSTTIYFDLRGN